MSPGVLLLLVVVVAAVSSLPWLFITAPTITAIACAVVVSLILAATHRTRRPNPFLDAPDIRKGTCPHCSRVIEQDDAIRTQWMEKPIDGRDHVAVVSVVMHERCARERQAVVRP